MLITVIKSIQSNVEAQMRAVSFLCKSGLSAKSFSMSKHDFDFTSVKCDWWGRFYRMVQ